MRSILTALNYVYTTYTFKDKKYFYSVLINVNCSIAPYTKNLRRLAKITNQIMISALNIYKNLRFIIIS